MEWPAHPPLEGGGGGGGGGVTVVLEQEAYNNLRIEKI